MAKPSAVQYSELCGVLVQGIGQGFVPEKRLEAAHAVHDGHQRISSAEQKTLLMGNG